MKQAAILGVVYGVISTLIVLIMLSISPGIMFSWQSMVISLLLGFAILIVGGRYFLRKIEDVDLSYGVAFKYLFVSGLVAALISMTAVASVHGNNEDLRVAFVDYQKSTAEKTLKMAMNMTGASKAQIESELEKMREEFESSDRIDQRSPYSMEKLPFNIGSTLVMNIIYALIAAIFVRVKHPE